jgi:hypothetical protein
MIMNRRFQAVAEGGQLGADPAAASLFVSHCLLGCT